MLAPMKRPIWPPISPGKINTSPLKHTFLLLKGETCNRKHRCLQKKKKKHLKLLKSPDRLKRQFGVHWDLSTYYKNASTCDTVTLDKNHLSCRILHIIYSPENTWQPFPYPEGLPIRRLSFARWFRSSAPQSRYPEPECYHCKQREREREKHDVLKSHIQMSLFIFSTLFFFIVFLRQRRWLVRLPLPADNRARVSSWANNLPSLSNFHGCGHWGKQGEVMTAVWFHTVLMS